MSVLSRVTGPTSYLINCILFILSFMFAGTFFSLGVAFMQLDIIWRGVVELVYGILFTTIGFWQLTIFLNKYIYYRAAIKPNIPKTME